MRYLCTNCNYIYDEGMGDTGDGIDSGIVCDDFFICPVCEESGYFHEIEEEINEINEDNENETLEQQHIPVIQILPGGSDNQDESQLQVRVGRESHPMGPDHRITTIALYDDDGDMIEEQFLNEDDPCEVVFPVDGYDEVEIRVRCSLHGTWSRKINLADISF